MQPSSPEQNATFLASKSLKLATLLASKSLVLVVYVGAAIHPSIHLPKCGCAQSKRSAGVFIVRTVFTVWNNVCADAECVARARAHRGTSGARTHAFARTLARTTRARARARTLTRQVDADGYYFVTGTGDAALDPIRWVVQAAPAAAAGTAGGTGAGGDYTAEAEGGWQTVGASGWRPGAGGGLEWLPGLVFDTPEPRGRRVDVNLRPGWPAALRLGLPGAAWAAALAGSATAGALGREWAVRPALAGACVVGAVCDAVCAAGFAAAGDARAAAATALLVPPQARSLSLSYSLSLILSLTFSLIFSLSPSSLSLARYRSRSLE